MNLGDGEMPRVEEGGRRVNVTTTGELWAEKGLLRRANAAA